MQKLVDARGLACPQPVVLTMKALEDMDESTVITLVNSEIARDNVVKFAQSRDLRVEVEEKGADYYIRISRGEVPGLQKQVTTILDQVLLISGTTLGKGDEALGTLLMRSFLGTLAMGDSQPRKIVLINNGVKLACEGSPVLDSLMALEQKGVEVVSCGTCLDYYKLKERLCVGSVTNMYSLIEALDTAAKVIHL